MITIQDIKNAERGTYTVKDLKLDNWEEYRDAWTRCYVSRKTKIEEQPILVAGTGEVYFLRPSWESTTYSIRTYMRPKTN